MVFAELIADLLPVGVLNIVQGFGREAGEALATSKRIAKIASTGSTPIGACIMKYARPRTSFEHCRTGRQVAEHFSKTSCNAEPRSSRRPPKAWCWFLQSGRGPHLSIASAGAGVDLRRLHGSGDEEDRQDEVRQPADTETHGRRPGVRGAAVREILSDLEDRSGGGREPAHRRRGEHLEGDLSTGYCIQPYPAQGRQQDARVFEEESSARWWVSTTFKDEAEALAIANDSESASAPACGTATSTAPTAWAGRSRPDGVWTNCVITCNPCPCAFGGYKSGVGREKSEDDALLLSADRKPAGQLRHLIRWAFSATPRKKTTKPCGSWSARAASTMDVNDNGYCLYVRGALAFRRNAARGKPRSYRVVLRTFEDLVITPYSTHAATSFEK